MESVENAKENGIIEETKKIPILKKMNGKVGLNTRPYAHLQDEATVGSGKDFTELQKRRMLEENRKRNGEIVISDNFNDYYDVLIPPKKCVSGISPDPSEWQFDHIIPKSKGGTNSYSNCQIVSRKYNRKKWDREE